MVSIACHGSFMVHCGKFLTVYTTGFSYANHKRSIGGGKPILC